MKRSVGERFQHLVGSRLTSLDSPGDGPPEDRGLLFEGEGPYETDFGPVHRLVRTDHSVHFAHLGAPEDLLPQDVALGAELLRDTRLQGFNREEALFLDVETTGLSHGAGTVAFLVGLGFYQQGHFIVEQYLLDDYDQEMAQLDSVLNRLTEKRYLVSYNGKSFDKSILETRFVIQRFMHRDEAQLKLMPHLDLLHVGRRILGGTLEQHDLKTLEREVLGFDRGEDIPGAMVPQLYFSWLLNRDRSLLAPVLHHNYLDIVSLAFLAHRLLDTLRPGKLAGHPRVDANLGRLFLATGRYPEALVHLSNALEQSLGDEAVAAARHAARAARLSGCSPERELELWSKALSQAPKSVVPAVELSKLAEHKLRNLPQALEWAKVSQRILPGDLAVAARIRRLETRLAPSGREVSNRG